MPGQFPERGEQAVGVLLHAVPGQRHEQVLAGEAEPGAGRRPVPPRAPLVVDRVGDRHDLAGREAPVARQVLQAYQLADRYHRRQLRAAHRLGMPVPVRPEQLVHAVQGVDVRHARCAGRWPTPSPAHVRADHVGAPSFDPAWCAVSGRPRRPRCRWSGACARGGRLVPRWPTGRAGRAAPRSAARRRAAGAPGRPPPRPAADIQCTGHQQAPYRGHASVTSWG